MKIDKERLRVLAEAVKDWSDCNQYQHPGEFLKLAEFYVAASPAAVLALLSENAALAAEVERLRGIIKVTTAIAITMLFDSCPEDVKRTFSVEELEKIVGISEPLQDQNAKVEDIYRHAWGAAMADKGGAPCEETR